MASGWVKSVMQNQKWGINLHRDTLRRDENKFNRVSGELRIKLILKYWNPIQNQPQKPQAKWLSFWASIVTNITVVNGHSCGYFLSAVGWQPNCKNIIVIITLTFIVTSLLVLCLKSPSGREQLKLKIVFLWLFFLVARALLLNNIKSSKKCI